MARPPKIPENPFKWKGTAEIEAGCPNKLLLRFSPLRLAMIADEIVAVENEKHQVEQMLLVIWELIPPLDLATMRDRMRFLRTKINSLESRKKALLCEQQELIVQTIAFSRN
ncbi:hypothetical protein H6P81_020384 [Aristolochia fimbriata]|uniref:Uncharacterized protein n=1 Tax=Aristolochia fimbriata TaxID=158543 RepID=A0AAV7DVE9_ARIFI|nr:hypothetical protein H6P81_020384 [Aristolochia fimbriata]